ncbi:LOW QUALITY PROTEIN: hypothetical protein ACHAWF_016085 [Thalassiosira exigua]
MVAYWLQKLKPLIPTYINDSKELLEELEKIAAIKYKSLCRGCKFDDVYKHRHRPRNRSISKWFDNLKERNQLPEGFLL